jgi:hypothetical protein
MRFQLVRSGVVAAERRAMLSLVAALLLAADPAPVTLFTEPLVPGFLAGYSLANGRRYLDLPLGLTFNLGATAFTAQLAFVNTMRPTEQAPLHRELVDVLASFGPSFTFEGSGFFVQPKLMVELGRSLADGVTFGNVQAGVDVGYQWRIGHLFVALALGVGAGFGMTANEDSGNLGGYVSELFFTSSPRASAPGFVWSLNPNLLRLGATF